MPISTEDSGMPTTRPKTGSLSRVSRQEKSVEGGGGTIYIPVSTEGSGMPTTRPKTFSGLGSRSRRRSVEGGGGELFTCPYPLKIQACPPQDQRPALCLGSRGRRRV